MATTSRPGMSGSFWSTTSRSGGSLNRCSMAPRPLGRAIISTSSGAKAWACRSARAGSGLRTMIFWVRLKARGRLVMACVGCFRLEAGCARPLGDASRHAVFWGGIPKGNVLWPPEALFLPVYAKLRSAISTNCSHIWSRSRSNSAGLILRILSASGWR